jgi:glycosyltransferase involved in cell wall biosynthesis
MKTSLVSIIIPTFNSEKFILEAIQSVQNQTYENWEVILVDCSSDNTVAIILEMVEKMIDTFFSA